MAEAELRHRAGPEAVDDDVGPPGEALGDGEALVLGEVDGEGQLRRVERPVEVRPVEPELCVLERRLRPEGVEPALRLDPHHRCAVVGEHLGRDGADADPAEVGHPDAGEGQLAVVGPGAAVAPRPAGRSPQPLAVLVGQRCRRRLVVAPTVDGDRATDPAHVAWRVGQASRRPEAAGVEVVEVEEVGDGVDRRQRGPEAGAAHQQLVAGVAGAQLVERVADVVVGHGHRAAGQEAVVVGGPVLLGPGLGDDALLPQPGDDRAGVDADRRGHHVPVPGRPLQLDLHRQREGGPGPLEVEALDLVSLHGVEHRPGHGVLGRHVDPLRSPAALGPGEADHGRHRRLGAGVAPDLGHRQVDRRPLTDALQAHRAAEGGEGQLRPRLVGTGPVEPERRDHHVDQVGVGRLELGLGDAGGGQGAGRAAVEDDLGAGHEVDERRPIGGAVRQVEDDRTLVVVVGGELQRLRRPSGAPATSGWASRAGEPPGGSTLTTSAPSRPSSHGPTSPRWSVRSSTR